jgi:hypothetical protein
MTVHATAAKEAQREFETRAGVQRVESHRDNTRK